MNPATAQTGAAREGEAPERGVQTPLDPWMDELRAASSGAPLSPEDAEAILRAAEETRDQVGALGQMNQRLLNDRSAGGSGRDGTAPSSQGNP